MERIERTGSEFKLAESRLLRATTVHVPALLQTCADPERQEQAAATKAFFKEGMDIREDLLATTLKFRASDKFTPLQEEPVASSSRPTVKMTVDEKMKKMKMREKIKELKMVADEKIVWAAKRANQAAKVAARVPMLFTANATYDEIVEHSRLNQEKKRVQHEIDILNEIYKPK